MLKAIGRATLLTSFLVIIGWALWYHTLIAMLVFLLVAIFGWLTFMLYMDPPDEWN